MLRSIAFIPIEYVISAFEIVKNHIEDEDFKNKIIINYFEPNFIGNLEPNSRSQRKEPRFSINNWNVYIRIITKLPISKNNIEAWNGNFGRDVKTNPTINSVIFILFFKFIFIFIIIIYFIIT